MKRVGMSSLMVLGFALASLAPGSARADQSAEEIKAQLAVYQDVIISLQDIRDDKSLSYRRHLHRLVVDLIQNEIDVAQKSGNADRVNSLKSEIVSLNQERDATWDESSGILDAELKKDQLLADQKIILFKQESAKADLTNSKKAHAFDLDAEAWTKYKPLIDQKYALQKQVSAAREKEDFKTANELYEKLKEVRKQMNDIDMNTTRQIHQLEEKSGSADSTNL